MIEEQQKQLIDQYLLAKNYSGIVDIIVGNSDPENDKHSLTLSYMMRFLPTRNLNIDTITELAEVFETNENAPSATLEAAYATFCEQAGVSSAEPKSLTAADVETKKIDMTLQSVAGLTHEEKIKTLATTMSLEEIEKNIKTLKERLQPALQTHQIDYDLLDQLSIFKAAHAQKEGIRKEFTVWDKEGSLDEVETRKPVRMVEGLDLLEELQAKYLKTLDSPTDDNQISQLLFLQSNNCLSKKDMPIEETAITVDNHTEQLVKDTRTKIKAKNAIKGDDMWWTDDKEYIFPSGSKIIVSKNDDHATYNFVTEGKKKDMTFTLSVHRVDAHGKLLPNAYDLVQYVDGEPIAMVSSTEGYSAIKNYDLIEAQIKLMKNPDFSLLQDSAKKQVTTKAKEKTATVESPAILEPITEIIPAPPAKEQVVTKAEEKAVTVAAPITLEPVTEIIPVSPAKEQITAKTEEKAVMVEAPAIPGPVTETAPAPAVPAEAVIAAPTKEVISPILEVTQQIDPKANQVKNLKPKAKKPVVPAETKVAESQPKASVAVKLETTKTEPAVMDEATKTQIALDTIRDKLRNINPLNTPSAKLKKDEVGKS